jgi:hypothetical protein
MIRLLEVLAYLDTSKIVRYNNRAQLAKCEIGFMLSSINGSNTYYVIYLIACRGCVVVEYSAGQSI